MWRFWNQVNTFYIAGVLRGVTGKAIDTQKVLSSSADIYIGVAEFSTALPKLLKPATGEELLTAIQASILMANVSSDVVTVDGVRYVDGGFARPHILQLALDEVEATHVLVLTNQDHTISTIPILERFLNHTLFRFRMPPALRFAAHERRRERMKVIEDMKKNHHAPCAIVWGDHSIGSMERNSEKIKAVVEKSRAWWHKLLTE